MRACLFDLDGVLTETATVHAASWKERFDAYPRARAERMREGFVPFEPVGDSDRYVDGKPRADGTRSLLQSRGITLPEGNADDAPTMETVHGLGNRKNDLVLRRLSDHGVEPYPGSVRYLEAARNAGLRRAVVSPSANAHAVLAAAHIAEFFGICVDGIVAERGA